MHDNRNTQLLSLGVILLLSVAGLFVALSGGGNTVPQQPVAAPTQPTGPPQGSCANDSECKPGEECAAGVCVPREDDVEEEVICAEGDPVSECKCQAPLKATGGICRKPQVNPLCTDQNFMRICKKVVSKCGANAGKDCRSNVFADFIIRDRPTIDHLMTAFTGHVALLFPTGQPAAGTDWPLAPLDAKYTDLIKSHFDELFNAKLLIALGRASSVGNNATEALELAGRRNNAVQDWLLEVCRTSGRSQSDCAAFKKTRITPAGIGMDRPIRIGEFRRVAHPLVRRGGSTGRDARWVLPEDDGQKIWDQRKQMNRMNGAKPSHVSRLGEVLDRPRSSRRARKLPEQYINQAVLLIPVPCDCKQ